MDNFNKIVSFVLGLIVVVVFIAVISGRLNLGKKLSQMTTKVSPTPTPSKKISYYTTPTLTPALTGSYVSNGKTPSSIPSTGSPTLLLPILLSGLGGGIFMRRTGKK